MNYMTSMKCDPGWNVFTIVNLPDIYVIVRQLATIFNRIVHQL